MLRAPEYLFERGFKVEGYREKLKTLYIPMMPPRVSLATEFLRNAKMVTCKNRIQVTRRCKSRPPIYLRFRV